MVGNERRAYQRSETDCEAKVSADRRNWKDAVVNNISSSGLQMEFDGELTEGARLFIEFVLFGLAAEFDVKTECIVRHKTFAKHHYVYGVEFVGLSNDTKIRIDETINQLRPRDFSL